MMEPASASSVLEQNTSNSISDFSSVRISLKLGYGVPGASVCRIDGPNASIKLQTNAHSQVKVKLNNIIIGIGRQFLQRAPIVKLQNFKV